MTVAALYDIHGNAPALAAVIDELRADPPDAVVIGGDVIAGPLPLETLELLRGLPWPVHYVRGNADRAVVMSFDGTVPAEAARAPALPGRPVGRDVHRPRGARLARQRRPSSGSTSMASASVLFCHATPRSDEERITVFTPPERLAPILEAGRRGPHRRGPHPPPVRPARRRAADGQRGQRRAAVRARPGRVLAAARAGRRAAPHRTTTPARRSRASRPAGYPLADSILAPVDADAIARRYEDHGDEALDPSSYTGVA